MLSGILFSISLSIVSPFYPHIALGCHHRTKSTVPSNSRGRPKHCRCHCDSCRARPSGLPEGHCISYPIILPSSLVCLQSIFRSAHLAPRPHSHPLTLGSIR
ncbi:hypothetical protein BJ322DRAFT_1078032 [Thelephora terrestris]|uniref:Secreted protein n=1 Tax=Thelephora terrestris TaxID=56493 RepID=A0A9P6H8S9_9AGAM|nr:hypothetical protein BJ322DRAFT_1078032 [Thelephora terrestris]